MLKRNQCSIDNFQDVMKDITTCPVEDQNLFVETFNEELKSFSGAFSLASKKIIELKKIVDRSGKGTEVNQEYHIFIFTYQFLSNLYSSVKLMTLGFHVASGNLLRQTVEGMALSWLLSLNCEIQHHKKGIERFNFYVSFKDNQPFARSMYSIDLLEKNKDVIGVSRNGVDVLKNIKNISNFYSHATKVASLHLISTEEPDAYAIGGNFDSGNIKKYREKIQIRIEICKSLPGLIEILISNIKNLN